MTTLSAWNIPHYGGPEVLSPVTRAIPTPKPREILIRIRASGVTRADGLMRAGQPKFARLFLGLTGPRAGLSGTVFSGEVVRLGADVTRFAVGDAVLGEAGLTFGANASHICLEENGSLVKKPDHVSFEEAATLCDGAMTSYHFLTQVAPVGPGTRVLILGGAGSLGSAAIQIAKALGAEVTANANARNLPLLRELGADRAVDYTEENALAAQGAYDVIFDTIGISSFGEARGALAPGGRYVCPVLGLRLLKDMLVTRLFGSKRAGFAAAGLATPDAHRAHLEAILDLMAEGKFAPVMDRTYPLADLVEAHRYVATGHKRGNVVVV